MLEKINDEWFTILIVLLGFVGTWTTLRNDSKWHTEWIKKHSAECDARETVNARILMELQISNAHLTTMVESHGTEIQLLRQRSHDLANAVQKGAAI